MPNIETILRDHVTLQVESIDRIYLGGYLPGLQRSGQLVYFLQHHRGNRFASPVLLEKITTRFVNAIRAFARGEQIPIVEFKPGERKDDVAKRHFARFKAAEGVVLIGVAKVALERTSHNCAISPRTFESVVLPSNRDGQHAPGLRFGEPRTMAVLAAACQFVTTPDGFSNGMLRERVSVLHDPASGTYTTAQMTYDLRRLRLKALIRRIPGRNRYVLTPIGRRVGLFFTKTYARVLRPGVCRLDPDLPPDPTDELASAWRQLDSAVDHHIEAARIAE